LLINGDLIFDVDFHRFLAFHREHKALASLAAHPNSHPQDSTLLVCDEGAKGAGRAGMIEAWLNKEDPERTKPGRYFKNMVNAGLHILSQQLLSRVKPTADKVDLDRDILRPQIAGGGIFAYHTPEYIKDMGTPERYRQVAADLEGGLVAAKNLGHKQRAVFLDRDGTVNKSAGFINKPEQLVLCDGAAAAIRRINDAGYLAIIVTNQPVIARGEATLEDLARIHAKLETDLGQKGAYVDGIFFCPHHPDKGFPGERPEYKIACECRKPKPGMLLQAAERYHIDLAASWMVGDEDKDAAAGRAAGCRTALIAPGSGGGTYKSLAEFVNEVL
jgi:D,D-heptose 1,7-bisphosphate phosphatase